MNIRQSYRCASIAAPLLLIACAPVVVSEDLDRNDLHDRLLVLDTHLDTPARLEYPGFDITQRHDSVRDYSQVDLPRMDQGGLDGGFWVIYTGQSALSKEGYDKARNSALLRATRIREMVARHSEHFELAFTARDAQRIVEAGRKVVFQSIENAYPLGEDLSLLDTFYALGVRMIGPVHSRRNQFADSATDVSGTPWGGLSPLGKALVHRANELGIVLDGSHAHDEVVRQMIELSATPIVLSHTGAKAVFGHPRNIDDALLKKLAASGGVIQMNALGAYLKALPSAPERWRATAEVSSRYPQARDMTADQERAYYEERRAIDARFKTESADFEDYMTQFLHVLELIGPQHVGVGADWDGGGGVTGMADVAALPRITERLLSEGYTEADLAAIWGGNVLRLLAEAEAYAKAQ